MIVSLAFDWRRYAVLGLARSGVATVRALAASGARVTAWDDRAEARDAVVKAVAEIPSSYGHMSVELADPLQIDLAGFDAIVVSPGVPLNTHPIAARARDAGVPVIGDIELFAQARGDLPPHKVVGITGTNGKSTVTALVHHILASAGMPTTMGGNIGLPILAQEPLPEGGIYVLELSSFQIDLTRTLDCDVAVLTNITPDHLDRYDGFEAYAASKVRLFEMQAPSHVALVGYPAIMSGLIYGGELHPRPNYFGIDLLKPEWQAKWPALQGPHNLENASAAYEVCSRLSVEVDQRKADHEVYGPEEISPVLIEDALRTYPGLPHRMERAGTVRGVLFVNDSKATNPTSAAPALAAYPRVHWILGGRRKTDELDACVAHYGHVAHAYTIGEATDLYASLMAAAGVPVTRSHTLDAAVRAAARAAQPGETVLFSPACASFDQYRDYEARGDAFKRLVADLGERP